MPSPTLFQSADLSRRMLSTTYTKTATISLHIIDYYSSKVYTTTSPITGYVSINTAKDTNFDTLHVELLGVARTRVDGVRSPTKIYQTFLKLSMPIRESSYPDNHIFEAGHSYTIPFHFVIPNHLIINACNHSTFTGAIIDEHLCLPPSTGIWDRDDLSPNMAQVEYSITSRVIRDHQVSGKQTPIMKAVQCIHVLPAFAEQPPLNITKTDRLYTMSKTTTLRKHALSSKLGTLKVSATQPAAVMISADGHAASTTSTLLDLTYEPVSNQAAQPRLTEVSCKLVTKTFYSAEGIATLPNLGDWVGPYGAEGQGSYANNTRLSSMPVCNFQWRHNSTPQGLDNSEYASNIGTDLENCGGSGTGLRRVWDNAPPVYYTGNLQIPIKLPVDKKMFLPTFHCCIASRVYILSLTVSVAVARSSSTVTLQVPLQVGVVLSTENEDRTEPPSFEVTSEEAVAGSDPGPRTLQIPEDEFDHDALPAYRDVVL